MFSILGNLGKFYDIFTKGKQVADAVKTKNQQNFVNALGAVLTVGAGLWRAYGHNFPLTDADLLQLAGTAGVIFGLFNVGSTVASTDKIGLPPRKQPDANVDPVSYTAVSAVPDPEPQITVQPEHKTLARVGGELIDSDNPLAGLDTTYRG